MRRLCVHCGLHKTGSTSIQNSFADRRQALAQAGFLYPMAGCPSGAGGHHNIAWEITGDRRFRSDIGGSRELVAEAAGFCGDVILSSEDFEGALGCGDRLEVLFELAKRTNRDLVLIIYLRNQISYAASLFQTLLGHGLAAPFSSIVYSAVDEGCFRHREWVFEFDYHSVMQSLVSAGAAEIVPRNYDDVNAAGSVVYDLAVILGIDRDVIEGPIANRRWAQRAELGASLTRFYRNCAGRPELAPPEAEILGYLTTRLDAQMAVIGSQLAESFASRFRPGNLAVCENFGLPRTGLHFDSRPSRGDAVLMERVFSAMTVARIREMANSSCRGQDLDDLIRWLAGK